MITENCIIISVLYEIKKKKKVTCISVYCRSMLYLSYVLEGRPEQTV